LNGLAYLNMLPTENSVAAKSSRTICFPIARRTFSGIPRSQVPSIAAARDGFAKSVPTRNRSNLTQPINKMCCNRTRMQALVAASVVCFGLSVGRCGELDIFPSRIEIRAPEVIEQIVVLKVADGRNRGGGSGWDGTADATRRATYRTEPADVVAVSPSGQVTPLRDGTATILIQVGDSQGVVPVTVHGLSKPPPISFAREVIPILSKSGCNAGGCHGKAEGQNGFKLSVFGYDPAADWQAIVHAVRGRRIFPAAPERSLLLTKATGFVPHGGGAKIDPDSVWHRRLRRWIAEGAALDAGGADDDADAAVGIVVEPAEITLEPQGTQQLRVSAVNTSGERHCVTVEAEFQSNNDSVAGVEGDGLVRSTEVPGEAAILVRYMGHVAVCRVTRPRDDAEVPRLPQRNFVDQLVGDKLQRLRIAPSPPADDATYLRRIFLDTIGTLPTVDEARKFLADTNPDKRAQWAARLLERPEYADFWAQRWADLLQADKDTITPQGVVSLTRWVRSQLVRNTPYDEFVRGILTAQGSTLGETPAAFFQVQSDAEKSARAVSQLFLGIRIECAQCHHHPFERWDQRDYFRLAGFFTGLDRRPGPGGSAKIAVVAGTDFKHPRTGESLPPAPLGAAPIAIPGDTDRRRALADWITSVDNPYFARMITNRIWAHYMGRGLVEPLDDQRATNPASNEPLLDALAKYLVAQRFDLKALTRQILDSNAYQLGSHTNATNERDDQNYSHAAWKPLAAEVLLDAVSQATGISEQFNGWPRGHRAIQVWDNKLPSDFLAVFGRPSRQSVCACERGTEPSIAQALHLMNSNGTLQKISDPHGRIAEWLRGHSNAKTSQDLGAVGEELEQQFLEEVYLATLSRFPGPNEREWMRQSFRESSSFREAAEDILWTLLNSREFVFNH